jgi:hypothetical protein
MDDDLPNGIGDADHRGDPRMAVLPLVEGIEGEGDTTADNQLWATSHPDGSDQTGAMGAPLVDVEDVGFVASQVSPQPRGGNRVPWTPKWELEEP